MQSEKLPISSDVHLEFSNHHVEGKLVTHANLRELLAMARSGDEPALGRLLDHYRGSLRDQARFQLRERLNTRVDHSDIVQETFLEASRDFPGFKGTSVAEWEGWLRKILDNNVAEAVRRHDHVRKRTVRVERPIDAVNSNGASIGQGLAMDQTTVSRQVMRAEEIVELNAAIDSMVSNQREAILLRYLEGMSLNQMAEHFDRSEAAVASLLQRGIESLRCRLSDGHPQQDE